MGADKYADIMGKTSRNQMSDKIGTNDEMVKAFNAMREVENVGRKLVGKQELPLYDNSSSTSQEAQADFDEFVRLQEQNKAAQKNSMAQAMGVLGDVGTAAIGSWAVSRKPMAALWKKGKDRLFGEKSPSNKQTMDGSTDISTNKKNRGSSENLKNQHKKTPEQKMSQAEQKIKELRSDRENYIKEEKKFQRLKDSEEKNLYNLKTQRDKLEKNGKDTSKVDADIQDIFKQQAVLKFL